MKLQQIAPLIQKYMPMLNTESLVYQEILNFFGDNSLIEPNIDDLESFLLPRRLFNIIKIQAKTAEACVQELHQKHPCFTEAAGMLRYYTTAEDANWADIEKAENAIGKSLAMDIYDWKPDVFTVFKKEGVEGCELVIILAFGSGD